MANWDRLALPGYRAERLAALGRVEKHAELVARFEEETGLEYDPEGPDPEECEYCGGLIQYMGGHDCIGTRGENGDAAQIARWS